MKMAEIKRKAGDLGVTAGTLRKGDLIRAIQLAEGNSACYGMSRGHCSQEDCCWRKDCLALG